MKERLLWLREHQIAKELVCQRQEKLQANFFDDDKDALSTEPNCDTIFSEDGTIIVQDKKKHLPKGKNQSFSYPNAIITGIELELRYSLVSSQCW